MDRLECQWCHTQNPPEARSCDRCGAPLDAANLVSDSGWREAPRLRDMAKFQFSNSECQVEGEIVPVAELTLSPGDGVIFEHHTMLWKDESVPISVYPLGGGMKRALGGMPYVVSQATGPGRIAFSRDAAGEVVTGGVVCCGCGLALVAIPDLVECFFMVGSPLDFLTDWPTKRGRYPHALRT